jgi:hypothetical protein
MATPPAGWKQSDPNSPGIYTNNSLRLIDKDKFLRPISVVANDINGSYMVYEKTTFGNKLLYQIDKNSNKNLDKKRFEDITIVDKKIEKDVYKLVQNTGIKDNIEALNNSKVYKHLAQVQQPPPPGRLGIGTSPDNTNNQNPDNADPASSPAVFDISSNNFQNDEEFSNKDWLKYPKDMNPSQDRIVITQRRYIATNAFSEGKISENAISQERFKEPPTKEQLLGTVILPMPNDISETNVTAWGEDSLSSLAALVGGAALGVVGGLGAGNFDKIGKAANEAIKTTLNKESGANETIKQLLTLNAAAEVTKKFGININPEAFRSRITGTAINPNLELLFQGPKLRSFAFQFKMSPRNQDEAKNIRYIIKFFKKGMAAKRNFTDSKAAYFLGTPNVFDINFKSGDTELGSIGKIKTCALQQCVVNYTPDGFYAAYEDTQKNAGGSQPIAVTMTLAFTELTPLYNDNYEDSDTVGWDKLEDGPTGKPAAAAPPAAAPGPAGQATSPTRTQSQGTGPNQPSLGLPPAN